MQWGGGRVYNVNHNCPDIQTIIGSTIEYEILKYINE